jgi:hypothetical protein
MATQEVMHITTTRLLCVVLVLPLWNAHKAYKQSQLISTSSNYDLQSLQRCHSPAHDQFDQGRAKVGLAAAAAAQSHYVIRRLRSTVSQSHRQRRAREQSTSVRLGPLPLDCVILYCTAHVRRSAHY